MMKTKIINFLIFAIYMMKTKIINLYMIVDNNKFITQTFLVNTSYKIYKLFITRFIIEYQYNIENDMNK